MSLSINLLVSLLIILPINCLSIQTYESDKNYDGYKVLRVSCDTQDQLKYLNDIYYDVVYEKSQSNKIDFWTSPREVNSTVDIMVSPDNYINMENELSQHQIVSKVIIPDVGNLIYREKKSIYESSLLYRTKWVQNDSAFFTDYHSFYELYQFVDDLVEFNPELSTTELLGNSYENRPMRIIKIGRNQNQTTEKPIIWIDAGIHAREWIAPMTALFIANKLVRSEDENIKHLLNIFDFHILPSANPDGYEYARLFDRMWRKTRSYNPSFLGLFCRGTDPNRNWNHQWKSIGSSSNPCSEIYHGSAAFSEPETRAMSNYILKNKDRIKMFISFHSYSQLILTPWGYTNDLPKDYGDMIRLGEEGAKAIKAKSGMNYKVGSSTRILYSSSGGSDDWAHGVAGIKYSYTFELRDTGSFGFVLPKEYIVPTGNEIFAGVTAMAEKVAKELNLSYTN